MHRKTPKLSRGSAPRPRACAAGAGAGAFIYYIKYNIYNIMDIVKLIQQTERRAKAEAELAKYKNTPELQR